MGQHFPNYAEKVQEFGANPLEVKRYMDQHGGPHILNYRFIKDFTKGVEDSWNINALNHFMLLDPDVLE